MESPGSRLQVDKLLLHAWFVIYTWAITVIL